MMFLSWSKASLLVVATATGVPSETAAQERQAGPGEAAAYKQACDEGNLPACYNLGTLHAGRGVPENSNAAIALFAKACRGGLQQGCQGVSAVVAKFKSVCDDGSVIACNNLGVLYETGADVPKDLAQAVALYKKACDASGVVGCANLGVLYSDGKGVEKNPARAVALFKQACDAGNAPGCLNLAASYAGGDGVPKDLARAATLYEKACQSGVPKACQGLARQHLFGEGVTKDPAKAFGLMGQACDGGLASSCWMLGLAYRQGDADERNPVKAARLFRQACSGGVAFACDALKGPSLGEGGPSDFQRQLLQQYGRLGIGCGGSPSCVELGDALYAGDGVGRNLEQAALLFFEDCRKATPGSQRACHRMGMLHESGDGVEKNLDTAVSFYEQACKGKSQSACEELKRLGRPAARPEPEAGQSAGGFGEPQPVRAGGSPANPRAAAGR
jgi:TPR repeat protein